jgi:hypothetical protein
MGKPRCVVDRQKDSLPAAMLTDPLDKPTQLDKKNTIKRA